MENTKKRIPVNEDFFKKWSSEMAYVLGYFTADGCMFINPRGSRYILFTSTEPELIYKTRKLINSNHKVGIQKSKNPKWKDKCTLQIGSKKMFQDLLNLNLTPNKSKTVKLPKIPKKYFNHFLRGYFDGDGCIFFNIYTRRKSKSLHYVICAIFISVNENFLKDILKYIRKYANIDKGKIYKKSKNSGFELRFADKNSVLKLYKFMYQNTQASQFLERKHLVFKKILNHWGA